jgi:hypothetical protein
MKSSFAAATSNAVELYPSFAVGAEARDVASFFLELDGRALESISLGKQKGDALQNLYAAYSEACQPGWDGYGAVAASYDGYVKAEKFIKSLPANIPAPEVAIDPDGDISLEWYRAPRRVFSVSIGSADELTFAGIFGKSTAHGTETFNFQIPQSVLANLRRLLS